MDCKHSGSQGPLENMNTISCLICTISSNSFSFFIAFWDSSPCLSAGLFQETCCIGCFAAVILLLFSQSLKGTLGADSFHPQTLLVRKDTVACSHCQFDSKLHNKLVPLCHLSAASVGRPGKTLWSEK